MLLCDSLVTAELVPKKKKVFLKWIGNIERLFKASLDVL